MQTLLHNAGYAVSAARSGHEALEMAEALKPELVLLDVGMPEMSGWQVCAALRSRPETAATPIAMLTVKSEIRDLITGMQVGADDYVTKPFTKRRLLETVERLLEGRTRERADLLPKGASDVRAATLLFDPVTGLPTIPVLIDALREWLLVDHEVGVLSVDVERFSYVEQFFGWEVYDELLREVARALRRTLGGVLSTEDLLAQGSPAAGEFYVFVAFPLGVGGSAGLDGLASKARALEEALRHDLSERFRHRLHREIALHVGVAKVVYSPQVRLERTVYSALREAARTAASGPGKRPRASGRSSATSSCAGGSPRSTSRSSTSGRVGSSPTKLSRAARPTRSSRARRRSSSTRSGRTRSGAWRRSASARRRSASGASPRECSS